MVWQIRGGKLEGWLELASGLKRLLSHLSDSVIEPSFQNLCMKIFQKLPSRIAAAFYMGVFCIRVLQYRI